MSIVGFFGRVSRAMETISESMSQISGRATEAAPENQEERTTHSDENRRETATAFDSDEVQIVSQSESQRPPLQTPGSEYINAIENEEQKWASPRLSIEPTSSAAFLPSSTGRRGEYTTPPVKKRALGSLQSPNSSQSKLPRRNNSASVKSHISEDPSLTGSQWSAEFRIPEMPKSFATGRRSGRAAASIERFDPSAPTPADQDDEVRQQTRKRLSLIGPFSISSLVKERVASEKTQAEIREQRKNLDGVAGDSDKEEASDEDLLSHVRDIVEEDETARLRKASERERMEPFFIREVSLEKANDVFHSAQWFLSMGDTTHPIVSALTSFSSQRFEEHDSSRRKTKLLIFPSKQQLLALCRSKKCPASVMEWLFLLSTSITTGESPEYVQVSSWAFDVFRFLLGSKRTECDLKPEDMFSTVLALGADPERCGRKSKVEDMTSARTERASEFPDQALQGFLELARICVMNLEWGLADLKRLWMIALRISISPVGRRCAGYETRRLLSEVLDSIPQPLWKPDTIDDIARETVSLSSVIRWQAEIVSKIIPVTKRGEELRRCVSLELLDRWHMGPDLVYNSRPGIRQVDARHYLISVLQLIKTMPAIDQSINFSWLCETLQFIKTFVDDEILNSLPEGLRGLQASLAQFKTGLARFVNPEALQAKTEFLHMLRLSDVISTRTKTSSTDESEQTNLRNHLMANTNTT